jgi:predicted nucleic acid-binding protein
MPHSALLDTSFVVAALDARDNLHAAARAVDAVLRGEGISYVLTDLVILETAGVLARRAEERRDATAARVGLEALRRWFESPGSVVHLGRDLPELMAMAWSRAMAPAGLNLADSILVEFALREGLDEIVSFDRDFDSVPGLRRRF